MIFRVDFAPYMSRESFIARGAQIFSAFRMLEFAVYTSRGQPCDFILGDAIVMLDDAQALVPPTVFS